MSEEALPMCNLSEGIYNKGYIAGYLAGMLKKAKEIAYELHDMGMADEDIAQVAEVSMETLHEWLAEREENLVQ